MNDKKAGLIKKTPGYVMTMIVLLILLILSVLLAVTFGSVRIPFRDVYGVILYQLFGIGDASVYGSGKIYDVVCFIRLPRLMLSMAVGMGLAVCGVIMQAVVKNPLAEPYTLGEYRRKGNVCQASSGRNGLKFCVQFFFKLCGIF